jgi:GT2 family glycosyltransferase
MEPSLMNDVIDVVVRCRNEMPQTARALSALATQTAPRARVFFIDCGSTDGSREAAVQADAELYDLDPAAYVAGAVLNLGMEQTRSDVVAFVNADAIALHSDALAALVTPIRCEPGVAATFGRQIARPDADKWTRLDYARAFPERAASAGRMGSFFSMAASAIRRDLWERMRFNPTLRCSEDVDWTQRAQLLGWRIRYVPEARFEHSHTYDLKGHYSRRCAEGTDAAFIFRLGPPSLVQDLARPIARNLLRDVKNGVFSPYGIVLRTAQAAGYYAGRRRAL